MDEDSRSTFRILMCAEICNGAGAGICNGAPLTCTSYIFFFFYYYYHFIETVLMSTTTCFYGEVELYYYTKTSL